MSNDLVQCSAAQRFVLSLYIYILLDSNNIRFCTYRHLSVFENERSSKRERESVCIHPATCNFVCVCSCARVYSPKCNCKIDENMALNALLKYLTLTMTWVYHWPFIHSLLNKSFKTFYPKNVYQRHCASTLLQMQPNRKRFRNDDNDDEKEKTKETNKTKSFLSISTSVLSCSQFLITLCARILYMKISVWYILLVTFSVAATASVALNSYSASPSAALRSSHKKSLSRIE